MHKKLIIIFFLIYSLLPAESDTLLLTKDNINPKIAYALSGGGARGLAHIGIMGELEKQGYTPDYLVGTSVGAIIGGLYASGYSIDDMQNIINNTIWQDIFSINELNQRTELFLDQKEITDRSLISLKFKDFNLVMPKAVSEGSNLLEFLQLHFWNAIYKPDRDFTELKVPLSVTATDLVSGKSVLLDSGNIVNAVKASATIPIRFTPVKIDSMILIDGGIFSNIPVEYALKYSPDIVVALNTTSPILEPRELNNPWNIADQTISVSIKKYNEKSLQLADVVFEPKLKKIANSDFEYADSLIKLGRESVGSNLEKLNRIYNVKRDSILKNINAFLTDTIKFSGFEPEDFIRLIKLPSDKISANLKNHLLINKYYKIEIIKSPYQTLIKAYKNHPISDITIKSISGVIDDSLYTFIKNKYKGTFKNDETISNVKETILDFYRKRGSSFATVEVSEEDNNNLIFIVDPRHTRDIIIKNNSIKDFLIHRYIEFKIGKPLNSKDIINSWNKLYQTGYFEELDIKPVIPKDSSGAVIEINYVEAPMQFIRLGARIDNEYNTQAGIDFTQENLFNMGQRITARFEVSNRYHNAMLIYQNPKIFSSDLTASFNAYYNHKDINFYKDDPNNKIDEFKKIIHSENICERFGLTYAIGNQFETDGLLEIIARYEKQRLYGRDTTKIDFNDVFTIKPALLFDSEDDPFFPTDGQKIELSLETNIFNYENNTPFTKVNFDYRGNYSLLNGTITPSLKFGVSDKTLPETEFFYLGGQDNFFGLRQYAERGRQVIKTSLEYRYKLPFQIFFDTYISGRYDVGSVWLLPESVKFNSLIHGAGISLALDTPLGASVVSAGKSFYFFENPNGAAQSPLLIYFSIGLKM